MEENIHKYKIFGRRKGRKKNLHDFDQDFLKTILTKKILLDKNNHNILDIGSGSGENSIYLSKKFPKAQIIACDNFEDGNLNLCKSIKINNIKNILIYNGNVLEIFDKITELLFDSVWILFTDPWPKKKHFKRRLISDIFIRNLDYVLKKNGKVHIVTDSKSYLRQVLNLVYLNRERYAWENQTKFDWEFDPDALQKTKFYKKAIKYDRKPIYIKLRKL